MKRLLALAILIAPFLAFPVDSAAEDGLSGSVTAGGTYVDLDHESFKYGEYTGMTKTGPYFVGDADIKYVKDAYYLDLDAKDAGLPDRSVRLDGGKFGKYEGFLFFDEIPHFISNNSRTPFDGAGGSRLTLPAGFVNGQTTPAMTNLSGDLKDVRLNLERKKYGGGFADDLGKGFSFAVSFDRETKKGTKSLGGTLGTSGGDTRSIGLPEPVDYATDTLRASLAYASRRAQAEFQYFLSSFHNENQSVTWDDPFFVTTTGSATALYPAVARTSLPPDNIQQKFMFTGGLNLPWYTRAMATAEYGISRQNESLLPYSDNPLSVINTPLPRSTADAEIDVKHLTLSLSSKPLSRLSLAARFRHYETDNKTPLTLFQYVKNDSAFGTTGDYHQANVTDSYALNSLPYDYIQNLYRFDASYYVFRATTVRAGYDYELVDRSFREAGTTRESTYRVAAQTGIIPSTSININYSLSLRKAKDPYDQANMFDAMHTQDYINTLAPNVQFDNNPLIRKFDVADRRRIKYGANISFFPSDKISGSLFYNYWRDFYENSPLGLQYSRNQSFTADLTVAPVKYASFYGFYTREESRLMESSNSFTGPLAATQSVDPTRDWQMRNNGNVDTYGVGANFGFLENRLVLNADYSYSFATNAIKFAAGSSLAAPKDMPLIKNAFYSVRLGGKYRVMKNLDTGIGISYDRYRATNWQTDGVDPASTVLANVLTLSGSTPDYRAVSATAFLTYYLGS